MNSNMRIAQLLFESGHPGLRKEALRLRMQMAGTESPELAAYRARLMA